MTRLIPSLLCTALLLTPGQASAAALRAQSGPYEMQVLIDGVPARSFGWAGETWVLGQLGARYTLRVLNHSNRRIEAVVSVDGRDVIDGRPGDFTSKRGYLVPAFGKVDIDGWRLSGYEAAAFRFSRVTDSYAARMGSGREVGAIGVAVFPERYVPPPPPVYVPHRCPHCYLGDDESASDGRRSSTSSPAGKAAAPQAGAADAPAERSHGFVEKRREAPRDRPGLGTEFGEAVSSTVRQVEFSRQSPSYPSAVFGVRYNDRGGLVAMGIDVDGRHPCCDDQHARRTAEPFPVVDRRFASPPPGWRE